MDRKKVELFWEHPGRYIFLLFLVVAVLCILLTFMPKWFNTICTILVVLCVINKALKWNRDAEKKTKNK